MKEEVYQFGKDATLVGIVSEPATGEARAQLPAVILLNAGLVHRIGPFRSSVTLARRLAALGYVVLRFDLSGLGDSETRKDSRSENERALEDVREAIELLSQTRGVQSFVLYGLCSGADYAHAIATADTRIVGAVMIDAYGWRTAKWAWRRATDLLFNMRKWRFRIHRILQRQFATSHPETYVREFPPKEQVRAELETLTARGVNMLFIYTAGVPTYLNYREQFFEMFGAADFKKRIEVEFYGKTDHTFFRFEDRERLHDRICNWMTSQQWARITPLKSEAPAPCIEAGIACNTDPAEPAIAGAFPAHGRGPCA